MNPRSTDASYMRRYLKYALECEKYVYIWTHAMQEANKRMQIICEKQQIEIRNAQSTHMKLENLDLLQEQQVEQKKTDALKYKRKSRTALTVVLVELFLLFVGGYFIGKSLIQSLNAALIVPHNIAIPIMGTFIMLTGFIGTIFGPVILGYYFVCRSKAKTLKQESNNLVNSDSKYRQKMILSAREKETRDIVVTLEKEEGYIALKQDEIAKALRTAKQNLSALYAENVLPAKYRNMACVATLYEYLAIPKYTSVYWNGGSIYSEYDKEHLQILQYFEMVKINQRLQNIEGYQRMICREMQQANQTLNSIYASIREIEKNSAQIATNTAISAVANKQTADAAQWMAFQMR